MTTTYDPSDFISIADAAGTLKVSKMTLYRWARAKTIISVVVAGKLCILKSEVERLQQKTPSQGVLLPAQEMNVNLQQG